MLRLACNITGLDELRYEVVAPRIRQKPPTLRRRLSVRKERKERGSMQSLETEKSGIGSPASGRGGCLVSAGHW